jgi:hypothetical protein
VRAYLKDIYRLDRREAERKWSGQLVVGVFIVVDDTVKRSCNEG